MNKRAVFASVGNVMLVEAALLFLPTIVAFIYHEPLVNFIAFFVTILLLTVLGAFMRHLKPRYTHYTVKDGFAITSLSWFALSFFGALPFVISREIPSLIDATFEMASGFTTTGASILTDVESLSHSFLFWRSFSHLVGGLGVLVLVFAFLPDNGEGAVNIMSAEVPGPEFGKLSAKNKSSAKILYGIYLTLTIALILLLMLVGLKPFDAIIHALGTAGTGGFSNKALSVGAFHNPAAEYILAIGMLLFGVNFNLYYYLIKKQASLVFKNEELRLYLLIVAVATFIIMLNIAPSYTHLEKLFRDALFQVATIISTTGFATVDFGAWPLLAHVVLLLIMFVGGMAGSTAGGLKVSRILIYFKTIYAQVHKAINPRRVVPVTVDKEWVNNSNVNRVFVYFGVYFFIFIVALIIVSFSQNDFITAFSSVAATINNIGPGMGLVGPTGSYAGFTPLSKMVLTFIMLAGRLEIYPVLIIFLPRIWKNR